MSLGLFFLGSRGKMTPNLDSFFPPQGLYSIIVGVEGSYQLKGKIFVRNLVVVVATTAAF
jgi:hypothetical protein